MKRRDIGKLLLIGLAAAGLQGCSQTAETTAADAEKPQVQTEAETDAASETKTAEEHTWQFTYFGTSTNEKSNTMGRGRKPGKWDFSYLLYGKERRKH